MSLHLYRETHPRPAPAPQVLCGTTLTPGHRITVFTVILVVVIVCVSHGQSVTTALGIVMAAGAAAARIGSWLSEQRLSAGAPGGAQ
ncbi:hypothetical protein [Streptomyces fagopyri]|uniref:hypothetical protein n=1 Tax=Streptomyces fagopyri TaxID=2662397 RepID=UPI0033E5741F